MARSQVRDLLMPLTSGILPIRQSRQLPKARHSAEARNLDFSESDIIIIYFTVGLCEKKSKKNVYKNIFSILS